MKESILRKIQLVASFALLLGVPSISMAANYSINDEDGTVRVSYSDLDLTNDAGVAALYRRLQRVSEIACDTGTYIEKGSIRAMETAKACSEDMLTSLVAEVDNEKLTAIHES